MTWDDGEYDFGRTIKALADITAGVMTRNTSDPAAVIAAEFRLCLAAHSADLEADGRPPVSCALLDKPKALDAAARALVAIHWTMNR